MLLLQSIEHTISSMNLPLRHRKTKGAQIYRKKQQNDFQYTNRAAAACRTKQKANYFTFFGQIDILCQMIGCFCLAVYFFNHHQCDWTRTTNLNNAKAKKSIILRLLLLRLWKHFIRKKIYDRRCSRVNCKEVFGIKITEFERKNENKRGKQWSRNNT